MVAARSPMSVLRATETKSHAQDFERQAPPDHPHPYFYSLIERRLQITNVLFQLVQEVFQLLYTRCRIHYQKRLLQLLCSGVIPSVLQRPLPRGAPSADFSGLSFSTQLWLCRRQFDGHTQNLVNPPLQLLLRPLPCPTGLVFGSLDAEGAVARWPGFGFPCPRRVFFPLFNQARPSRRIRTYK